MRERREIGGRLHDGGLIERARRDGLELFDPADQDSGVKRASSAAMQRSAKKASPIPAPAADPWTLESTIFGIRRTVSINAW